MNSLPDLPRDRSLTPARQHAARSQLERFATSRRERIAYRWRTGALVLGLGVTVGVAGGAAAGTIYLTKGPVPIVNGSADFDQAPDFVSVVSNGAAVGYAPKDDIIPSSNPSVGFDPAAPVPVYASDLTTLVGHVYPGVGFVRLGESPDSVPCMTSSVSENGTTSTIPCPNVRETVPNVTGLSTPAGVVAVQAAGLTADPQNQHSGTVPNGYIIGTSPAAGTSVSARTPVTVFNSLGP
jgi:PASTA domain